MPNFKLLLLSLFSGPDGALSSKRVAGFVYLVGSIFVGILGLVSKVDTTIFLTVFSGFTAASLTALGISSMDVKSYFKGASNYVEETPGPIGFNSSANPIIIPNEYDAEEGYEEDSLKMGFKIKN